MRDALDCMQCHTPLMPADTYCPHCGKLAAHIRWSLSAERHPGRAPITVRPGGTFYVVAENLGQAQVRITVDADNVRGARLQGLATAHVEGYQTQAFVFQHLAGEELAGTLRVRSREERRKDWWERADWREEELRISGVVRVHPEQWLVGSEAIVFPPGVQQQRVRIWNDSERERVLVPDTPAGYEVRHVSGHAAQAVPSMHAVELVLRMRPRAPGMASPDREWRILPETRSLPLFRLESTSRASGADAVVAIDFGTRNTGVRVRWRRTLIASKPAGHVDIIGDRTGNARFPSAMVVHKRGGRLLWGSEADDAIQNNRLDEAAEFAVDNLKTYLRAGEEPFREHGERWTCAALLERYFERLFDRLDTYFRTADPAVPLQRTALNLRYVLTRPVLDWHDGDVKGRRYEQALLQALERCGVPAEQVTFALEPVAAAIGIARHREQELLSLNGQAIAVVDAGGGTTDVAIARVHIAQGRVQLNIVGSYALHLNEENPAHTALRWFRIGDRVEFGGNVLDCVLAYQLMALASSLLETEGRPVPENLDPASGTQALRPKSAPVLNRQRIAVCRRMKERFAHASRQYLNWPAGTKTRKEGSVPFPNQPYLEGVYLEHSLVDENLFRYILQPVVTQLSQQIMDDVEQRLRRDPDAAVVRPDEVKRVFYVGGTCIDAFVRERFGLAFPNARGDTDAEAQSPERIAERLNAVVEGAVWYDEQLFSPSPLTLTFRSTEREETLLQTGELLLPASLAHPRFITLTLAGHQELDACLFASGEGLPGPVCVARGFYRNPVDRLQEVTLRLQVSREQGATAVLLADGKEWNLWRFILTEQVDAEP